MEDLTVAKIILSQLGGNKFIAMTGANNFIGGVNSLSFRIGKNAGNYMGVRVVLTPLDDYTLTFYRHDAKVKVTSEEVEGVYAENLEMIFEDKTGLRTRL